MLTSTPSGKKIGILRGQTSSTRYSPTKEKTSAKEVKEQAENWRRYVFIFLSIWYPVALCVEKFICVYCPRRKATLCTPFRAKVVVISMAVLTGTCYYYVIYMFGPNVRYGIISCSTWTEVAEEVIILMTLDTIFACGVPCIILIVLVLLIFAKGCEYYRVSSAGERTGPNRDEEALGATSRSSARDCRTRCSNIAALRTFRGPQLRNHLSTPTTSSSSSASSHVEPGRVTNVIFPVVGATLLLQMPTFAFRFMFTVFKLEREVMIRLTEYQPLFIYMNNLAWAIKFYIYLLSSLSFRKRTLSLLFKTWYNMKACDCLSRQCKRDALEERNDDAMDIGEAVESRIMTNRPINVAERREQKKAEGRFGTDV
ncbi:thyrotropin-releasing hormone receptor-like [Plakobranchus ocellatus]|uniref:Thyrotropin-releasing hormone receptor-like n=1 Tax=Plakobranchus ocellatus TaxID=259542 RepID=A0AAV3YQ61_9GAST|nr:thyrotropin-releasing hormone receptor-like [Plakobranchus ocellatus]